MFGVFLLLVLFFVIYNILVFLFIYFVQLFEKVDIFYGDLLVLVCGVKIVNIQCVMCYRGSNGKFIGQLVLEKEFGDFYIVNIMNYLEVGIGKYFDVELVYLLCMGLCLNGEFLLLIMLRLMNMLDWDISSIVVYLCFDVVLVQFEEKFWFDV